MGCAFKVNDHRMALADAISLFILGVEMNLLGTLSIHCFGVRFGAMHTPALLRRLSTRVILPSRYYRG